MKIVVCYAGHLGTTKECAEHIKSLIPDADLFDLFEKPKIDFSKYDRAIFGTNIRVGRPAKPFKKYIKKYKKMNCPFYCYYMGGIHSPLNEDKIKKLAGELCPDIVYGGGEYRLEGAVGFAKMVNNAAIGNAKLNNLELPHVDYTEIDKLIARIKQES